VLIQNYSYYVNRIILQKFPIYFITVANSFCLIISLLILYIVLIVEIIKIFSNSYYNEDDRKTLIINGTIYIFISVFILFISSLFIELIVLHICGCDKGTNIEFERRAKSELSLNLEDINDNKEDENEEKINREIINESDTNRKYDKNKEERGNINMY